jgi:hypothetical protein
LPVACGVQCDRNPLAGDNGRFIVDLPAQRPDRVAKIGVGREAARRELAKEIGLDVLAIDLVFACEVAVDWDSAASMCISSNCTCGLNLLSGLTAVRSSQHGSGRGWTASIHSHLPQRAAGVRLAFAEKLADVSVKRAYEWG